MLLKWACPLPPTYILDDELASLEVLEGKEAKALGTSTPLQQGRQRHGIKRMWLHCSRLRQVVWQRWRERGETGEVDRGVLYGVTGNRSLPACCTCGQQNLACSMHVAQAKQHETSARRQLLLLSCVAGGDVVLPAVLQRYMHLLCIRHSPSPAGHTAAC